MARFPALVDALARVDGRDRGVLDHMAREIREAGLIQTTKRGRGSADMTSLDAAHLILGVYGSDGRGTAAAAAGVLGPMPIAWAGGGSPDEMPADVAAVWHQKTLAGAVAAVIELGERLAEQTPRTQNTLPLMGPLFEPLTVGLELEGWPDGTAVLLRIHRPSLEALLAFAWRGNDRVEHDGMLFRPSTMFVDDVRPLAAFEQHMLIHTDVFRALHRVLYGHR